MSALIEASHSVMAAKAIYKVSYIESRAEDSVILDGVRFRSKVLRKHFDKVERVFPYVVTIGTGVEDYGKDFRRCAGEILSRFDR